jgi:cysteine desulfurase
MPPRDKKTIYLDHAATTPIHPQVLEAMLPFFKKSFGNPSSIYSLGKDARAAVEIARTKVAKLIGVDASEIFFTSGGTEADNLAIMGTALANKAKGSHIITSAIEHHAVLNTCINLEEKGFRVSYVPVDKYGMVDLLAVKKAITDETILITIMHANNEVGVVQPLREIGAIAKQRGIIFHTDAVQSVGKIPVDVDDLNVDLLSIAGHKIYGPKGIGALYIRNGLQIMPSFFGGHQESGMRPGTENVPAIVGLGAACEIALHDMKKQSASLKKLRDMLQKQIEKRIPNVNVNGHVKERLPHILSIAFEHCEAESIIANLDLKGIYASAGAACTAGSVKISHVLSGMNIPPDIAASTVRFSLGRSTTEKDILFTVDLLEEIIKRMRSTYPITEDGGLKSRCIITFSDSRELLSAEKLLSKKDVTFSLIALPLNLRQPDLCTTGIVCFWEDKDAVVDLLKKQTIKRRDAHRVDGYSQGIRAGVKRHIEKDFWAEKPGKQSKNSVPE